MAEWSIAVLTLKLWETPKLQLTCITKPHLSITDTPSPLSLPPFLPSCSNVFSKLRMLNDTEVDGQEIRKTFNQIRMEMERKK